MTTSPRFESDSASASASDGLGQCFHCEEPIRGDVSLFATIGGQPRAMCCHGCVAVAELIASTGLDDYYKFRTAPAIVTRESDLATQSQWQTYDQESLLSQLTQLELDGTRSARLGLNGMGCAACGWLIDRMLTRQSGIVGVHVNVATATLTVSWRSPQLFSSVLRCIAGLGFQPYPLDVAGADAARQDESRTALKRLAVAGLGMMQVMMFAVGLYYGDQPNFAGDMDAQSREYLREISLLCTLPVLFYSGWPILSNAVRAARARTMIMDVPVGIALLLAFAASVWNTFRGHGTVYFDSVVMFVFFLTLGRYVEMRARHRTGSVTDALARLLPRTAHVVTRDVDQEIVTDVAVTTLECDAEVIIRAGEIIPADGIIITGSGRIDESMLTGESLPVTRKIGAKLTAGTLNLHSPLRMRVTALGQATILSGIVRLLQGAAAGRIDQRTAADKTASWFLSRILIAAAVVAGAWLAIDPAKAFEATLAVLVVTCPCALSLAMPTAYAAATATLARRGILVVKQTALDALSKASCVVFDKTGTLTYGEPIIDGHCAYGPLQISEYERIAAALEQHSEHPLARAFSSIASADVIATDMEVVAGAGVTGTIDGRRYRLGKLSFVVSNRENSEAVDDCIFLSDGVKLLASFRTVDRLRAEVPAVVQALGARGLRTEILSGDAERAVQSAATQSGIDYYLARQSPADKLKHIRALADRDESVVMVGDGINDAPVLAGATVSIAMGGASALAHASSDILLVRDSLNALPEVVDIARRTAKIVRQNLVWAAAYNFVALPLAALGFVPPWVAAIGMSLSSMLVVLNALRLAPSVKRTNKRIGALDISNEAAPARGT